MSERNVPELRFRGFSGEWEKQTLDEVVQITMGQSPDGRTYSDTISDYVLVQGNADLKNGWVLPRIWTTQITKIADAGDLIMSVRAPAGAMGKTAYTVVIGRGVAAIKGNEFIYQSLVKKDKYGFWRTLSCGSTFESLNADNIKYAEIKVPTENEQAKIGEFFKNLDDLIAQNQKKYDKLVNMKKACLDKMFPKDEADTPEVRFKGFGEGWTSNVLGNISKLGSSKRVHREDYTETGVPFFRGLEISKLGSSERINDILYISEHHYSILKETYGVPKLGDILITSVGTIGNPYLINNETPFYFKDGNLIWISDIEILPSFLNIYLGNGNGKRLVMDSAIGSNQKALTMVKLEKVAVVFPDNEEQQQVSTFFQTLDNLITLQKTKLEKLKNIKKACLDKMFI